MVTDVTVVENKTSRIKLMFHANNIQYAAKTMYNIYYG